MTRSKVLGGCFGLTLAIFAGGLHGKTTSALDASMQTMTVRSEPDRVVLSWSGPIAAAMRDALVSTLNKFKTDPRRMVLVLNSPGGSLAIGRDVVAAIRDAAKTRTIDTFVGKGAVCASMCVPVYLLGANRLADPGALFMFHEATLNVSLLKTTRDGASVLSPSAIKVFETAATELLFDNDLRGRGVNTIWLANMRSRIEGHDVWMSGRQLVDEASGVIDALAVTTTK